MQNNLTTAVVMATYNGEKYIVEQLDSLKNQERKIDEVIIFDDRSSDNTATIIEDYINKNNLVNWHLKVNTVNKGWRENFMSLLSEASSDIIFTSDQDDIWLPNKIKAMTDEFEKNADISVLVSDYDELIENTGSSAKLRKIETVEGTNRVKFVKENVLLKRPGCVFGIRKTFVPVVQDYYKLAEKSAHDVAMWAAGLLYDELYYLPLPTIMFRRHANSSFQKEVSSAKQQTGIYDARINTLKRFNVRIDSALNFMRQKEEIKQVESKEKIYREMEAANEFRINILSSKKINKIIINTFNYPGIFNYFADLYHVFKVKNLRSKASE